MTVTLICHLKLYHFFHHLFKCLQFNSPPPPVLAQRHEQQTSDTVGRKGRLILNVTFLDFCLLTANTNEPHFV